VRGAAILLVVAFLAATVFALSNTTVVTVMFWQWPIYSGSLALALVGAGILGALLTYLPSVAGHGRLRGRIRELERRVAAHERPAGATPAGPAATAPAATAEPSGPAVSPSDPRPSDIGQTRRLW
jgi:uncharacterized integral membrane protein